MKPKQSTVRILGVTSLIALLCISTLQAAGLSPDAWPSWRGPEDNGGATTGKYPVKFDANTG
ncbi:MAG TPA: hypothetical protein VFC46_16030, partial [Humisphaera sp.]|nr:hypothetical protein [Humisphaera sp.]